MISRKKPNTNNVIIRDSPRPLFVRQADYINYVTPENVLSLVPDDWDGVSDIYGWSPTANRLAQQMMAFAIYKNANSD